VKFQPKFVTGAVLILSSMVGLAFGFGHSPLNQVSNGRVVIADVDPFGIGMEHAINLLRHHQISAYAEGSVVYGIFVEDKDAERAKAILLADAVKHPYDYDDLPGFKGKLGRPDHKTWPLRKFDIDIDKINSDSEFKKDANLRGVAREVVVQLPSLKANLNIVHPYIREIRTFTMEYMNKKGAMETGYEAEVTLGFRGRKALAKFYICCWNQGRDHMSYGSNYSPTGEMQ
jgi:hypothetical protein